MICKKCNNEIPDDSKFCIKCGAKVPNKDSIIDISFGQKEIAIGIGAVCIVFLLGLLIGKGIGRKDIKTAKTVDTTYTTNYDTYEESNESDSYELNKDEPIYEGLINFNNDENTKTGLYFPGPNPELNDGSLYTDFTRQLCDVTVFFGMDFCDFEKAINNSKMGFVLYGDKDVYDHPYGDTISSTMLALEENVYIYKDKDYIASVNIRPYNDSPDIKTYADYYVSSLHVDWNAPKNQYYTLLGLPGNINSESCANWTVSEASEYLKSLAPYRIANGAEVNSHINKYDNMELTLNGGEGQVLRGATFMTAISLNGNVIPVKYYVRVIVSPDNKFIGVDEWFEMVKDEEGSHKNFDEAKAFLDAAGYSLNDIYTINNPRIEY